MGIVEVDKLYGTIHKVYQTQIDHVVYGLIHYGIDMSLVVPYNAKTYLAPLPEVIVSNLRYGDIKAVLDPLYHRLYDLSFALERKIAMNEEIDLADPYNH